MKRKNILARNLPCIGFALFSFILLSLSFVNYAQIDPDARFQWRFSSPFLASLAASTRIPLYTMKNVGKTPSCAVVGNAKPVNDFGNEINGTS